MTVLDIVSYAVAGVSLAWAALMYREARKWATQCRNARIAVSYNRRVKINAPLIDWLLWANSLKGQDETGRVVFQAAKVSVAILRPNTASLPRRAWWNLRSAWRNRGDKTTSDTEVVSA